MDKLGAIRHDSANDEAVHDGEGAGQFAAPIDTPANPADASGQASPLPSDAGILPSQPAPAKTKLVKKRRGDDEEEAKDDASQSSASRAATQEQDEPESEESDEPPADEQAGGASGGDATAAAGGDGIGALEILGGLAGVGLIGFAAAGGGSRPNSAPVAQSDSAAATEDGAAVTGTVATNDSDADGDTLTYALSAPVAGLTLNGNGSYSFDPSNAAYQDLSVGETRAVVANYTVSDGNGGSATSTLTITVTGTNDAPVAVADIAAAAEGGAAVTGSVAANDSDADDDALVYALSAPVAGLTFNANGSYSFDPANAVYQDLAAGETRAVVADYTVSDGNGGSATSTLTITVTGTNDAPVAVADTAAATEDGAAVTGSVATNDSDVDGDTLAYALDAPVAGLTLNANGSYSFDPANAAYQDLAAGETRVVVADYTASDGNGGTATSTLTITVTGTNDAPVAVADTAAATEDGAAVTGTVATNDSDVDGDALAYALSAPVAGLTFNANGSYSFDPANAVYQDLAAGETRAVVADYTVSDGNGGSATSTLTITVTGTNDAPVAVADTAAATEDAAPVTGSVAANDSDVDGDTLAYALNAPVVGLTLNANGSYSFDPANAAYQDLAVGVTRVVVADYTVSDGNGGSATSTLTITVTGTNDAPVAVAESFTVDEDGSVSGNLLSNDTDIDGDALIASVTGSPANGTVVLNPSTGAFTYTPNTNFNGTDSFTYVANDGTTSSAPVTVTITVNPVNDAPVSVADAYSLDENTSIIVPTATGVLANDVEPDGDSMTAILVSGVSNGALTLNPNGSFTYTPTADFSGIDSFTYRASDGTLQGPVTTVAITVNNLNDAPVATPDNYATNEDQTLNIPAAGVLTNDSDANGDPLTAVLESGPANGTLTLNANGSFSYTPNPNFNGADSFTYRPNDGSESGDPVTVTIIINPVNDGPISAPDSYSVNEDQALTVPVGLGLLVNDSDLEGDSLSIGGLQLPPANGVLTLVSNGSFTYTPNANFSGTDSFSYRAFDGSVLGPPTTVTITVNPVNDAPVGATDSYTVDEDATLTIPGSGVLGNDSDVDGDALTAILATGPANGILTLNADGSFAYTPDADFSGTDSFTYRPDDGTVTGAPVTVNITVDPVNDAPVATGDSGLTDEDTSLIVTAGNGLLANDSDIDGPSLSVLSVNGVTAAVGSTITLASGAQLTVQADGSYVYNPNGAFESLRPGDTDTDTFTYVVSDGDLTDTATATITIEGRNEVPVAGDDAFTMAGNTPITFTAAQLLGNDSDPDGPAASLSIIGVADPANGTLVNNGDGTYTFTPTTGFEGAASFSYTVADADGGTDTATVNLTVSGLTWYVDNSYSGSNGASDGSFLRPFTSLTQLNGANADGSTNDDVDGAGDTIFIANTAFQYTGGITLEADQRLFGDGQEFTVNGIQIGGGVTTNTTINHSTYGVTLSTGNEIRGININGTATGAVGIQDGNGTVGNLTIGGVSVTGQGQAVDIDQGGVLAVSLNELSSLNALGQGVHLQSVSGNFTAATGTIQGSTQQGFLIGSSGGGTANSGGNADITYGGSFVNAGASSSAGIEIQDRTGGTLTFSGNLTDNAGSGILADGNVGTIAFGGSILISSGASTAVSLTNNSATLTFSPTGSGIDIVTTSGNGFIVDGGGTITLSGTGNTVATTSGRAVEIDGVTIGTGGVTFQSVAVGDGASNTGIFLRNAGSGGFNITGTGTTAGSGGTINSIDGGTNGSIEGGIGIYIENTGNISLANMNVTGNFGNFGIRGVNVNNFTLRNSTFNGADADDGGFGNSGVDDEGTIRFTNLTGTALFEGNTLSDGHEDVIRVDNGAGTLNMTVRDSATNQAVIGRNGTTSGNDGILVLGSGTSNITLLVDGVNFTGSRGDLIQTDASGTAVQNITIRNSSFINGHPDIVSGGGGLSLSLSAGTGAGPGVTYNVEGNTFRGSEGTVILTSAIGPSGQMAGTILNNTIGTANGVYDSGQANTGANNAGAGIAVRVERLPGAGSLTHSVRIEGNTIRDVDGDGIFLRSNGASDGSGTARLEATIRNNTIAELGANSFAGIYAQVGGNGAGDNGLLGVNIENNVINLVGASTAFAGIAFDDIANNAQFYFPGYAGPYTDAGLEAFLTGAEGNTIAVGGGGAIPVATAPTGTFATGANFVLPVPLMVAAGFTPSGMGQLATDEALEALREAAIQLWIDAGATDEQVAAMRAVDLGVADLFGGFIGQTSADGIVIDDDAAGFGWFIDSTPELDEEFVAASSGLVALADSDAANGIDLLTALAHELGHVAGFDDLFGEANEGAVMFGALAPGVRHDEIEAGSGDGGLPSPGPSGVQNNRGYLDGHEWDRLGLDDLVPLGSDDPAILPYQIERAGLDFDALLPRSSASSSANSAADGSAGLLRPAMPGGLDSGWSMPECLPGQPVMIEMQNDARVL